ncbi:DUF4142 domain-containing protein [Nonomuraea typhae]|uniref:DUF4142 domain-containing protein n=1 Tax=Nonomuraea typhae TaxID=2603600 RepID=UPI001FE88D44|nr:DUF4142 domain-containing protein [Nonomuraea typhae]
MLGSFAAAAAVTVVLVLPPGSTTAQAGWTMADSGPLGPADRDLLVKVRQAGLWEIPTSQQAQQRGQSARLKEVAGHIIEDHLKLDVETRAVAAKLNVPLPSAPSADQQTWMAQISAASPANYDSEYTNLLRQAHGKVFAVVALVRAGTRNDEVRKFAAKANAAVLRHMTLLESIGLVNYSELPEPPAPR